MERSHCVWSYRLRSLPTHDGQGRRLAARRSSLELGVPCILHKLGKHRFSRGEWNPFQNIETISHHATLASLGSHLMILQHALLFSSGHSSN